MNFLVQRSELRDFYSKVAAGERISEADALRLLKVRQRFQPVSVPIKIQICQRMKSSNGLKNQKLIRWHISSVGALVPCCPMFALPRKSSFTLRTMNFFVQRSELRGGSGSHICAIGALICVVLLCSCATAPDWYADDSVRPTLPAETSFNKEAGLGYSLFVTLHLEDGEQLLFGVDTGSPITILDNSLASRLGKRLKRKEVLYGWLGKATVDIYKTPKLHLGDTELLAGDQVWVDDLSRMSPRHPMKGILGMDCLRHYCIQLDFAAGKMRFLDPDHLVAQGLGKAFPLSITRSGVTIHASLVGARSVDLGIDTAEYLDGALQTDLIEQELRRQ